MSSAHKLPLGSGNLCIQDVFDNMKKMSKAVPCTQPQPIIVQSMPMPCMNDCYEVKVDCFADTNIGCANTPTKKGTNMYIDTCNTREENAQMYLRDRQEANFCQKDEQLHKDFGLRDNDAPRTIKDMIDRITTGQYVIRTDKEEVEDYNPLRFIRWRNPATQEDQAGYKLAKEAMYKANTKVSDAIMVKTPTEALTAVEEFQTATFH